MFRELIGLEHAAGMGAPQRLEGGTQFNIPGKTKTVMFFLGALGNNRNRLAEGQFP